MEGNIFFTSSRERVALLLYFHDYPDPSSPRALHLGNMKFLRGVIPFKDVTATLSFICAILIIQHHHTDENCREEYLHSRKEECEREYCI